MKLNFSIAWYGQSQGPIRKIINRFGAVTDLKKDEKPPKNTEVLVVDCDYLNHELDEKLLYRTLKQGCRLCVLKMNESDLKLIMDLSHQNFSSVTENIFICADKSMEGGFRYSIIPSDQDLDKMDSKEAARILVQRILPMACGGGAIDPPPETKNLLYPEQDLSQISGSVKQLVNINQLAYEYPSYGTGLTQSCGVTTKGYFYHSNGAGGDSNYHIILETQLVNVKPYTQFSTGNGCQYGVIASLEKNGQPYTGTNVATFFSSPAMANPSSYDNLGNILITGFGAPPFGYPPTSPGSGNVQVNLSVPGTRKSSPHNPTSIIFDPLYYEVLGQYNSPSIGDISVTVDHTSSTPSRHQLIFATSAGSGNNDNKPGKFSVINYLVIKQGLETDQYRFDLKMTYELGIIGKTNIGQSNYINRTNKIIGIDLIEFTQMQPAPTVF